MKTTLPKLFMIVLSVYFNVSCYIGTQRDSCRYNLKENGAFGPSPDSCELLQLTAGLPLPNDTAEMIQSRGETLNFLLLNCYRYYERLQECNKEENRFIPSIYGINSNPTSDAIAERIVREK